GGLLGHGGVQGVLPGPAAPARDGGQDPVPDPEPPRVQAPLPGDREDAGAVGRGRPADRAGLCGALGPPDPGGDGADHAGCRPHAALRAAGDLRGRAHPIPRMMSEADGNGWIGRPLKRREDHRILIGAGSFVDDLRAPGCAHVALLRSPHAHARIARLDVEAARRAAGVLLVVTGRATAHLAPMPGNRMMPDMKVPPHPILADGVVTSTGIPVAAVVAESVYAAHDAIDLIEVEYEPLPALPEPEGALAAGAPAVFPGVDGNRVLHRALREGDAAAAFAEAAHVVPLRVAQSRVSAVALEPRSVLATFDRFTEELTMWVSCQAPFRIRAEVARLLELPESRVRVIAPDVGGGFGVKTGPYREDVLLAWLAPRLGRPGKWVATRREDQATTNQARGSVCEGELALDASGRITGLRAR